MPTPLDKMQIVSASNESQPLLHPNRMEKMVFVKYWPPPANMDDRAEYDMWLERVSYLCDDLHWLLQLPHDKFWCQAVFDTNLHKALDSFLQYCPRSHDVLMDLPEVGKQKQSELCRLVFMTYLRMSTYKESKDHFLTPEVFGEILYENYLFDIPKIFDICSLFGKNNGPLLNKMVGNIFTQQPKYTDDLRETIPTILQVFSNIAAKCGIHLESVGNSPKKLEQAMQVSSLSTMPTSELQDVLLYLSDSAVTLHRFLDVYTPACQVFQHFHFCSVIANFYESVIPELASTLKQHEFSSSSLKKQLTSKLHHSKKSLLAVFRSIVQHVCIQPVLENAHNEEVIAGCTDEFLHTLTSVLGERKFLAAYESMYCFQDDVSVFMQASSLIDASQFEYIQSAINSAFATFGHRKSPRGDTNTGGRTSPDGAPDSSSIGAMAGAVGTFLGGDTCDGARPKTARHFAGHHEVDDQVEGAVAYPRPQDIDLELLITSVKDLFPHLGEGFIEHALEELGWDQEKVVSCILEDKLPASLKGVSHDLPRFPKEVDKGNGQTDFTDILDSRINVFDNDEFDMFRNKNVDLTKVHVGKKNKKIDINDKSVVKAVKATYDLYGSVDQKSIYDSISEDLDSQKMYEDEYDDTYDSHEIGAVDADSADELNSNKVLPRVLMDLERKKAKDEDREDDRRYDDSDSDDDNDDNANRLQKKDHFVADPALLREQAEQKRISQAARGRRGRGGGAPVNRDVIGNAKGQGQSKDVVHNRRMKEKFKGKHNRNSADKKMSKGMF